MARRVDRERGVDDKTRRPWLALATPALVKRRAALYVDGYNLYHALLDQGRRDWPWLDLRKLGREVVSPWERLGAVVWVGARNPGRRSGDRAMAAYEAALSARGVRRLSGHFVRHGDHCRACGHRWMKTIEKQSDVNLALAVASDAAAGRFDTAYLLTTDGDHAATARFVKEAYPERTLIAVTPPGRTCNRRIAAWADGVVNLGPNLIARSLLPERVRTRGGWIERPAEWAARD